VPCGIICVYYCLLVNDNMKYEFVHYNIIIIIHDTTNKEYKYEYYNIILYYLNNWMESRKNGTSQYLLILIVLYIYKIV